MIKLTMDSTAVDNILKIYDAKEIPAELKARMEDHIHNNGSVAEEIVQAFLKKNFTYPFGSDIVDKQRIRAYLVRENPTDNIVNFWECVTEIWIGEIRNDPNVCPGQKNMINTIAGDPREKKDIAKALSKWNGMKSHIFNSINKLNEKTKLEYIKEIITLKTLPFFVDADLNQLDPYDSDAQDKLDDILRDRSKFKSHLSNVKFRYRDTVFHKKNNTTNALDLLSAIFDYDLLKDEPRHQVLSNLYTPVCPYCNRQYITKYDHTKPDRVTADLDHFYCKEIYPYLALSVYNFVPSCPICNSRIKHTADFYAPDHLYPYKQESNAEMKFKLKDPDLLWVIQKWKDPDVEKKLIIDIVPGDDAARNLKRKNAVINSVESLRLKEVYKTHNDYVCELMCDMLVYSDHRARGIYNDFNIKIKNNGQISTIQMFRNPDEIKEMVFGHILNEDKLDQRPLAKLTYDLLQDLLPKVL